MTANRVGEFAKRRLGSLAGIVSVSMVIGSMWGCGGSQVPSPQTPGTVAGSNVPAAPPVDRSRCKADGKQVITVDTDANNKPDVWKYLVPNGQGAQVMTCKQVDLNHDGKIDNVYYFDEAGQFTTLEEFDLDFDGRIDISVYYSNGKKVRTELDTNYDNRSDLWRYYEDGKLVRIERDSDFNGKVDVWEYYENEKLDRIGYDTTGSGRVDRWDRTPDDEGVEGGGTAAAATATPAPAGAAAPPAATTAPAPAPAN